MARKYLGLNPAAAAAMLRHLHLAYNHLLSLLLLATQSCPEVDVHTTIEAMQAARLGFRVAFRPTARAVPRQSTSLLRTTQQTRFASVNPRFPNPRGSGGQSWSRFGPTYRAQYLWRTYRNPILVVGGGGTVFYVANLETVPVTGRRRFNVVSPETEKQLSQGAYQEILAQFEGRILPSNHRHTEIVAKVAERLIPHSGLQGEEWRVHVIDDKSQVNAFVIPGGKIFVFTGILAEVQNEEGLAAVLGHEIAHNVAHHSAERMSTGVIATVFAFAVSYLFDVSGGLGQQIGDLALQKPNGRTQEQEADHIGLLMMAESCYDPKAALDFWQRMYKKEKAMGGSIPQFMSTHPTSYNRSELIRGWLPQAEAIYQESGCVGTGQHIADFNQAARQLDRGRQGQQVSARQPPRRRSDGDDGYFF